MAGVIAALSISLRSIAFYAVKQKHLSNHRERKEHRAEEPQPKSNFSNPIFLPQNASFHPGPERQKNGVRKIVLCREDSEVLQHKETATPNPPAVNSTHWFDI
jgi:hypothetical protein